MKWIIAILLLCASVRAGRFFDGASSQLGVATITPISPPITIAVWQQPWAFSNMVSVSIGSTTNNVERLQLSVIATPELQASSINTAGVGNSALVSWSYPLQTNWIHQAGVFASSTLRVLYTNGVAAATNTTSTVTDGLDRVAIAARLSTSWGLYYWGRLAEVAVWSTALSAIEMQTLAGGAAPFLVGPSSLVFYAPLTGRETATEWNLVGSAVSLTNGPTTSIFHPRIYYP